MLQFIFNDGNNTIYDEMCNYKKVSNKLFFACKANNYKIEIDKNNLYFEKANEESKFILQKKGEKYRAYIHLIEKNIDFDIKVLFLQIKNDDYIKIEYILESDEKSIKSLEIRY